MSASAHILVEGGATCAICNHTASPLFQKDGYWIEECDSCGHRFAAIAAGPAHTKEVYGDSYFNASGDGYADYRGERDLLVDHGRRYGKLLVKYTSPGTVLDVGAAAGFILKGLTQMGWRGTGVEPNSAMSAYARSEMGMDVRNATLEDLDVDDRFDLVTMIQVVPHFYDLRRALEVAARATRPGGHWLIETWDRSSLVARLFGPNWHEYSPPSVLHWFSRSSLAGFVSQFGFEQVATGTPQKWLNGSHAKSLVGHKLGASPLKSLLKVIPDGLRIPYPSWDLFWGLYRKVN